MRHKARKYKKSEKKALAFYGSTDKLDHGDFLKKTRGV